MNVVHHVFPTVIMGHTVGRHFLCPLDRWPMWLLLVSRVTVSPEHVTVRVRASRASPFSLTMATFQAVATPLPWWLSEWSPQWTKSLLAHCEHALWARKTIFCMKGLRLGLLSTVAQPAYLTDSTSISTCFLDAYSSVKENVHVQVNKGVSKHCGHWHSSLVERMG